MELSSIVHLASYRDRKGSRLRRTLALHGHDAEKSGILLRLSRALDLSGGDRAALIWVDEYGPGLPHAFVVLDLAADRPRRTFSPLPLSSAWGVGVPGLLDAPVAEDHLGPEATGIRSAAAVALGSDGPRSWFLYLDSLTPRPRLSAQVAGEIMFLAGECASILLHRDLRMPGVGDGSATGPGLRDREPDRFEGWPVLSDIEGLRGDEESCARIATRFLVARVTRTLVDDHFTVDSAALSLQLEGVRRELPTPRPEDPEHAAWERVLSAIGSEDHEGLLRALLEWGPLVEGMGHLGGGREIHGLAYDLAVALGSPEAATDAARFMGRVARKLTRWAESIHWYGVARGIAEEAGNGEKLGLVLDGMANAYRDRGNLPRARELLQEVLALGRQGGNRRLRAIAHHDLMTVEKLAGHLQEAVVHGWEAAHFYDSRDGSLMALFDLAGVLKDGGELSAAWDAYSIVETQVEQYDYRVLSLDAMAHIAALRGIGETHDALRGRVDEMNWGEASPVVKAQVLLYRGRSARALGRSGEAREWLRRALEFCEKHRLSQLIFEAEKALEEQTGVEAFPSETQVSPAAEPPGELREVRKGLRRMREALAGVGGPP